MRETVVHCQKKINLGLVIKYTVIGVANGKCKTLRDGEMARPAIFSARPRLLESLDCQTKIKTTKLLCFVRRLEKTRMWDPWNWLKFCQTLIFSETIHQPL